MEVEVKELEISSELKKKIDMICRFAGVSSNLTSGCVKNIKGTNIAYVKPPILSVNGNDYLLFGECDDVFINGYSQRIKLKDIFRNILLSGKDKEKDIVINQIKDCYANNLYNDSDITYITKDTSKEKEMTLYLEEKDYDIF